MQVTTELLEKEMERVRAKPGRPKGVIAPRSQRILDAWDALQRENPKLNQVALLSLVAETLYGPRMNASVRKRDSDRLKRTLRRHKRIIR
jgi:hypothetical protein